MNFSFLYKRKNTPRRIDLKLYICETNQHINPMENKPSLFQHTMTWGAITGIILIVFSLVLYLVHQSANQALGYLSYVLLIAGIIIGSIAYRDKVLGGFISYKDAFVTGLLITIFAGILSSFFSFILIRYIDPSVVEQSIAKAEEKMISRGMAEDDIELAMEKTKEFIGSPLMVLVGLLSFAFIGTIISLITAAIVKKEKGPFDTGAQAV
jgi:hypothetical protein